jgi:signal transduction histidine kinase
LSRAISAPRRAVITLLRLLAAISFGVAIHFLLAHRREAMFTALSAGFAYVGCLRAYQRGWEGARHLTVAFVTLLVVVSLREPYLAPTVTLAVLLPPVLALALTSAPWVLAIAILEYSALIVRGGLQSIYLDPAQIGVYAGIVSGLSFTRHIMDRAHERVEAQRERAEDARREAEQRTQEVLAQRDRLVLLGQLLDAVDPAIFACDPAGRIVYANRSAARLTGSKSPLEQPLGHVLRLERESGGLVGLSESTAGVHEAVVVRPDGTRVPTLVAESAVRNAEGAVTGSVTVCTDVSRIKALEQELQHAQRVEAIGRLAGGIAHDFNNLLTVIGGAATMASYKLPAGHDATEEIEEVVTATGRAGELTRQLLAFARKQVLNKRPIELSALVSGLERMLRRLIGEHITLVTRTDAEPLTVNADAGQIEQVLMNLAINARDAMPAGGTLTIVTSGVEIAEDGVRKKYARLEVVDSGSGMSDAVQARIFEPFFTTKTGGRGTGLGLATCFGIVKQHEGQIQVSSRKGEGTRMTVLLPRSAAGIEEPVSEVRVLPRGTERVLVAEDDEAVRRFMALTLREAGYDVTIAENGREAFELFSRGQRFDVLVADVVMPGLGGPELVTFLRRRQPDLAIVLTSGYADARLQGSQRSLRDTVFRQKPFSPSELIQAIKDALARAARPARQNA